MRYVTLVLSTLFSITAFAQTEIPTEAATTKLIASLSAFQSFNLNGFNVLEGTLVGDSSKSCIVRYRVFKRNTNIDGFTMDIFPTPSEGVMINWSILNMPTVYTQTTLFTEAPLYISTVFKGLNATDTPATLEIYIDFAAKMIGINNNVNGDSVGLGCEGLKARL